MRTLIVLALAVCACCTPKGGAPRIGKAEKGTRIECKDSHKVVDDPAKCDEAPAK